MLRKLQNNFNMLIENRDFKGSSTNKFREMFVRTAQYEPNDIVIAAIKEYLCEAF